MRNSVKFLGSLLGGINMNINELLKKKGIKSKNDYSFLENNKDTMDNLLYMVLSGSYAYGTNVKGSDIDIRVIRMNRPEDILLMSSGHVHTNEETDTTTYNINNAINMFRKANPNVLEFLGNPERNALYIHPYFKENILDNRKWFLSKTVFFPFGGFMDSQINRLNNKVNRTDEETIVQNLMRSINKSKKHLDEEYNITIGKDFNITADGKLMELNIKELNLDNLAPFLNEVATICKNAKEINKLTKKQRYIIEHARIEKHILHYVRLANMGSEILLTGEINTYREKDHDLLMSIRNNENKDWLTDDGQPTDKCMKYLDQKRIELQNAFDNSKLPDKPDMDRINLLLMKVNKDIITGDWK